MARSKNNKSINNMDEKKVDEVKVSNHSNKIQYKQMVLIIIMTIIMIMVSLALSFSLVSMLGSGFGGDKDYNSIIIPIRPGDDDKDDDDDKDNDKDHDHDKDHDKDDKIIFSYEEKETLGNGILIKNMLPTLDDVGMNLSGDNYTFEFKLNFGAGSYNHYYEITAEMLEYTNLSGDYVKIYLETSDVAVNNVFNKDGKVKKFTEYKNATIDKKNDKEKIIHSGYISRLDVATGYRTFVLKMWVSEDMPLIMENMGKTFAIRINVYAK